VSVVGCSRCIIGFWRFSVVLWFCDFVCVGVRLAGLRACVYLVYLAILVGFWYFGIVLVGFGVIQVVWVCVL